MFGKCVDDGICECVDGLAILKADEDRNDWQFRMYVAEKW